MTDKELLDAWVERDGGYSAHFEMMEHPWHAPVIVYDDGQAKLNPHLLRPDRPVKILLEGTLPNTEQLEACRALWNALAAHMEFNMATFCPKLLSHCHEIMTPA
jgi:hypothetical protein